MKQILLSQKLEIKKLSREELYQRYSELKKELKDKENQYNWEMYKIISEAYNIGKRLYGRNFSKKRLAIDFGITYSTLKKLLILKMANREIKDMVQQNKLSLINAGTILESPYRRHYQSDIAQIVIKDDLSYHDITKFRPKKLGDLNLYRQRIAAEKGYKQTYVAMQSLMKTLHQMDNFLIMDYKPFGKFRLRKIMLKFSALQEALGDKIVELKEIAEEKVI